jgi:hypothetical protein
MYDSPDSNKFIVFNTYILFRYIKDIVVVLVLVVGPISTAAMKAYCTLTTMAFASFISRGAAHQAV